MTLVEKLNRMCQRTEYQASSDHSEGNCWESRAVEAFVRGGVAHHELQELRNQHSGAQERGSEHEVKEHVGGENFGS